MVSLRNLAATIVDLVGLEAHSPFPGSSLAHYWRDPAPPGPKGPALSEVVPGLAINVDAYGLPQKSWPLGTLDDGDWSYIRGQDNAHEELFHLRNDFKQQRNLARSPRPSQFLTECARTWRSLPADHSRRTGSTANDQTRHSMAISNITDSRRHDNFMRNSPFSPLRREGGFVS